jgi:hypothetical protein
VTAPSTPAAQRLAELVRSAPSGYVWLARRIAGRALGPEARAAALERDLVPKLKALAPAALDAVLPEVAEAFGIRSDTLRKLAAAPASTSGPERTEGGKGNPADQPTSRPASSSKEDDEDDDPPEVKRLVEALNERHFVTRMGGQTVVGTTALDPVLERETTEFGSFGDFTRFYSNQHVFIRAGRKRDRWRKEEVGKVWLGHPRRRQFDRVVFLPDEQTPENCFNLWRGWAVEAVHGDCSLYWEHVRRIICAGDDEKYRWVRKWMAHAIQMTRQLPGTALVLRGLQGTGKGEFARYFGSLFGQHFLPVTSMEHVAGRFNGHLRDTIVLFADEALWGGDRSKEGNLKALVTEAWVAIEAKNIDLVRSPNFKRVIASTNNEWAVARDMDDRRFLILDVAPDVKEDIAYFSALRRQMSEGGLEALLWDLRSEDLAGFLPWQIPASAARSGFDMKLLTASPVVQWWHECLVYGENFPGRRDEGGETRPGTWDETPHIDELHAEYRRWCERLGKRYIAIKDTWARELRKMAPHLRTLRPREDAERPRRYDVGTLAQCREAFERFSKSGPELWKDPEPPATAEVPYEREF